MTKGSVVFILVLVVGAVILGKLSAVLIGGVAGIAISALLGFAWGFAWSSFYWGRY